MKIAVLFDGAGLARWGLEQAGHRCTGFEIDPWKHHLSLTVGSGNSVLADATKVDLSGYDAVWASPPCQKRSQANTNAVTSKEEVKEVRYAGYDDYMAFSLALPHKVLWVENVVEKGGDNSWGNLFNAAQFLEEPIQSRVRMIGGRYLLPHVFREYKRTYPKMNICPTILASQGQGGYAPKFKRAEGWYGRKMTLDECAYHQGFTVPEAWRQKPSELTNTEWTRVTFEAIGNGVPVYMAKAFGDMFKT